MANTPNMKYNSGGVPQGGLYVDIYRPSDPESPNSPGAVKLGTYLVESCSPSISSTLTKRPDIDGGKNGWFIIEGDTEGSATIQRSVAATPTLANGDYFDATIRIDASGNGQPERFVIHMPNTPLEAGYRKMSVNVIVDTYATGVSPRNPLNGA